MLGFREDRQTLRPMDETAPGPLQDDTDRGHRGAYPSTAAVPPRCLASLVVVAAALAVTDTYDGYERCSLTDLMDMYTSMSDNSYQYHTVVLPIVLPLVTTTSITIIISRRIEGYIELVRIVRTRGPYHPGRLGHGPYRLDTSESHQPGEIQVRHRASSTSRPTLLLRLRLRQSIRLCTLYRPTST